MNFLNLEDALAQLKYSNDVGDSWIEPLKLWINTVVRNHLLRGDSFPGVRWVPVVTEREHQLLSIVEKNPSVHPINPRNAPQWLLKCINEGVAVDYIIVVPDIARRQLSHLEDFFKDVLAGRSQFNMSVQDAIEAAEEWVKALNRKTKMDIGVCELIDQGQEYKMVKLIDKQSYAYEGKVMEHCVKNYFEKPGSVVWSVRDKYDVSHATIELQGQWVVQLRGIDNQDPIPDALAYANTVLQAKGIKRRDYGVAPMQAGAQTIEVSVILDARIEISQNNYNMDRQLTATITVIMTEAQAHALQAQVGGGPPRHQRVDRNDYMGILRRPEFQR